VETQNRANEHALGLDGAAFAKLLALLPLANYRAGETVLTAGSKSGRLLILKSGAVVILKDSIEIARVEEPGAVFGELSALLDQPHTADVRALESVSKPGLALGALSETDERPEEMGATAPLMEAKTAHQPCDHGFRNGL